MDLACGYCNENPQPAKAARGRERCRPERSWASASLPGLPPLPLVGLRTRARRFSVLVHFYDLLVIAPFDFAPAQLHAGGEGSVVGGKLFCYQQYFLKFFK